MKTFMVDTGKKKYSVEANDAEHAVELVKKIADAVSNAATDTSFGMEDGKSWKNVTELREGDNFQLKGESRVYKVKKINIYSDVIDVYTYTGEHFEFTWQNYVHIWDSMKDEASPLQTVNALLEDERAAVEAYDVAIENLRGKIPEESLQAIIAIRDDENRHIENLQAVVNGTVTEKNLEDSIDAISTNYKDRDAYVRRKGNDWVVEYENSPYNYDLEFFKNKNEALSWAKSKGFGSIEVIDSMMNDGLRLEEIESQLIKAQNEAKNKQWSAVSMRCEDIIAAIKQKH